jgi:solute carrier family 24 (sodium/potassium/calcium exchanger), member 6
LTSIRLSEAIAGCTLLAFANGAPDIISSVTAGGETDGIFIGLGGLVGACSFGATVVLGTCVLKSNNMKGVQMDRNEWIRDLIFYMLALGCLIIFGISKTITYTKSLVFLMLYLLYIIVIIYVSNFY